MDSLQKTKLYGKGHSKIWYTLECHVCSAKDVFTAFRNEHNLSN